ncbi:MAG: helix-turn-helix domain-containing protein [archaeon]|nr:helix-turn-helix domain-containing protein [archaeon]
MDEFNIWDLERVHIRIRETFFDKLIKEIDSKFKSRRDFYNGVFKSKTLPFSTFRNFLKKSHASNFFIPLEFYLKIVEKLGISREELQENIISYKTAGGINFIENPILPIKINPIFDMLLAHHIGDGTVINPKLGRLPYFGYRQFNEFYRVAYIKKIEQIFGNINFKNVNYFLKSTRPYCPPVLSTLFFKYYNLKIEDFLSDKARIPPLIFENKERMLAVLIAFIIDEGHIDSTEIVINLKNKPLISDLGKFCDILGYEFRITEAKSELVKGYVRLHILRKGMKKLYRDYLDLRKLYPIIDLGWKGEKTSTSFKIESRLIIRTKGNAEFIFEILKKESLSVNQLAERINMTRQGVRYHIHNLLKQSKIKIIDNQSLNWRYGI